MVMAWPLVMAICAVCALLTGEFSWASFVVAVPFLLVGALLVPFALWTIGLKHELQTRGPYRWSRHPYFLAILLMLVGATIMMRSLPALVLLVPAVWITVERARREERNLALQFGSAYLKYQARVPFLIPLCRRSRPSQGIEPENPR
ncbi:MAG: methyltransferase family protein [Thermoanaerobaculales bacterium]